MLLATRNRGKIAELEALLEGLFLKIVALDDVPRDGEVEEDQSTLAGNARKKAMEWSRRTGLAALADDSGLEVSALGGRPGVHSARFAGVHADDARNRHKLLAEMEGVEDRRARFRTVMALASKEDVIFFEGICEGSITREERGERGFGYDPVFEPRDYDRTFAEMLPVEKNAISHRALASRKLRKFLQP